MEEAGQCDERVAEGVERACCARRQWELSGAEGNPRVWGGRAGVLWRMDTGRG